MTQQIRIVAVGDLAPLRSIVDCDSKVNQIWENFIDADVTIGNLEIALTESSVRADKVITLKADPDIAFSLARGGFNIVSVANNHAMDFGSQGLYDTLKALKKANIEAVGGGVDLDAALEPVIQNIKGTKIAHFGLCSTLPAGFSAAPGRPGVAPVRARSRFYIDTVTLDEQPGISPWVETSLVEGDLAFVCKKITEVKEKADFVIINIHWGIPHGWCALFQGPLADYQKPLAHGLIDAGADLILGHHPHVIHGVEQYKGGIIAYSLGNFLFHSMSEGHVTKLSTTYPPYNVDSLEQGEAREAVIMEASIEAGTMKQLKFYPIAFNKRGEPTYLLEEAAIKVLHRLQNHSTALGSKIGIDDHVGFLEI